MNLYMRNEASPAHCFVSHFYYWVGEYLKILKSRVKTKSILYV